MLKFKTRIRMGKKGEFNYFKCMMVAGPGWGGVRIQGKKRPNIKCVGVLWMTKSLVDARYQRTIVRLLSHVEKK